MKFSEKIIKIRKENGLSQEEFGDKINVSRQAISKWESEQSQPEVDKVKEISKVFGVSIEYLLNDDIENDNAEKERKFNKKNLFKTLLKILIVLIVIYLIYCGYKFVLLWNHYNNIQQIPESSEYKGSIRWYNSDNMLKEAYKVNDEYMYSEQIRYRRLSGNFSEDRSILDVVMYTNRKKDQEFYLVYDEDLEKFVYSKEVKAQFKESLEANSTSPIRENSMNVFLEKGINIENPFLDILRFSINPTIIVTQDYIKYLYEDGYRIVELDCYDGTVYKDYTLTDTQESITSYDYSFPDYNFENVESLEDFAEVLGIEVEIEK